MTAAEFKEAIRPFVQQYMSTIHDTRMIQGHSSQYALLGIESVAKGQATRMIHQVYSEMANRLRVEEEVYQ